VPEEEPKDDFGNFGAPADAKPQEGAAAEAWGDFGGDEREEKEDSVGGKEDFGDFTETKAEDASQQKASAEKSYESEKQANDDFGGFEE